MTRRRETLLLQIIAITVVVFVLAPLFLMFATSFKADKQQVLRDLGNAKAFWVWPSEMSLSNFRDVLSSTTFPLSWPLLSASAYL
jgi:multiple sugar transport system permease protein